MNYEIMYLKLCISEKLTLYNDIDLIPLFVAMHREFHSR